MTFDIRTLLVIIGLVHLLQVLVLANQFKVNKAYKGTGWWLLWSGIEAVGFFVMLLRGIPALLPFVIIIQNTSIVLGTIFIYIGIIRFFNKKENLKVIIPFFVLFESILVFFTFGIDNIWIRSITISFAISFISFFTAFSILRNKLKHINSSVNFLAYVFILHGCVLLARTILLYGGLQSTDVFSTSLMNIVTFINGLVVGLLWTFGIVIMLNQRLNAEMKEAKDDFEQIFNTSPDAVVISRIIDGYILNVNAGFIALSGYKKEESVGYSSVGLNIWKYGKDRDRIISELNEKGYSDNFEAVFQRKDGSAFTGLMSAKIINIQSSPHIISLTRDITYRKINEEALRNSEDKFKSIFENMASASCFDQVIYKEGIAVDYRVLEVNPAYEKILGISKEDVIGKLASEIYKTNNIPFFDIYAKVAETGVSESFESFFAPSGIFLQITASQPAPGMFSTVFSDITERRKAENILLENEEKFRNVFEFSPLGKSMTGLDGSLKVNRAFCEITGYTLDELKSKSWKEITHPDDIDESERIVKAMLEGKTNRSRYEKRYLHKNGNIVWTEVTTALHKDINGNPEFFITTVQDINERKNAEATLKQNAENISLLNKELKEKNSELEQLIYISSHDLRSPLVNIQGFGGELKSVHSTILKLLENENDSIKLKERLHEILTVDFAESLNYIEVSAKKMDRLIAGLLRFSRLGKIDVSPKKINMNDLMDNLLRNFEFQIMERNIKVKMENLPDCNSDENLLDQLFSNLIGNAIKFKHNDRQLEILIEGQVNENEVVYSIEDNGIGFSNAYVDKIFLLFNRLNPSIEGEGLGLAIVKKIADKLNGRVWAESEVEKGSKFFAALPK